MSYIIDLSGKVALVTGSSRGLGKAIAMALSKAGASVVITSRNRESLNEVEKDMLSPCIALELDVRNHGSIKSVIESIIEKWGRIDILVNNAGINVRKKATELSWEDWDMVLNTILKGTFFCSQVAAQHMINQKWGRIINIGSATNIMAYPHISAYCAARGGILQLTKSLAAEWAPFNLTVNVLAPGWFRTEQTRILWENMEWINKIKERIPVGRMAYPHELGSAAIYLASEDSAYITGSLFVMDGAFTTGGLMDTIPLRPG